MFNDRHVLAAIGAARPITIDVALSTIVPYGISTAVALVCAVGTASECLVAGNSGNPLHSIPKEYLSVIIFEHVAKPKSIVTDFRKHASFIRSVHVTVVVVEHDADSGTTW